MKIALLLLGLSTIVCGLPVNQNSEIEDGVLVEGTRSNEDNYKIEEQGELLQKTSIQPIFSTTTTARTNGEEVKNEYETSTQIWEKAKDKVESDTYDKPAWEARDQSTTAIVSEEVTKRSSNEFSTTPAEEQSEDKIEIITKPTLDNKIDQSSTTEATRINKNSSTLAIFEDATAIAEDSPSTTSVKTEEELTYEVSSSTQTSTESETTTTTTAGTTTQYIGDKSSTAEEETETTTTETTTSTTRSTEATAASTTTTSELNSTVSEKVNPLTGQPLKTEEHTSNTQSSPIIVSETSTTTSESISIEADSTTPLAVMNEQALTPISSVTGQKSSSNTQSTPISQDSKDFQTTTTTNSVSNDPTTPASDQALSFTKPGADSASFEDNSSSTQAVEQTTFRLTTKENEDSETTLSNQNDFSATTPVVNEQDLHYETSTASQEIFGQDSSTKPREEFDTTSGSILEEGTETVAIGSSTASTSEDTITEDALNEDRITTERVEEELLIGQEVVTNKSEVIEVATEDSTDRVPILRQVDQNTTPKPLSTPDESKSTVQNEDSKTTFSSKNIWETSTASFVEDHTSTDSGDYQPEQETEAPYIDYPSEEVPAIPDLTNDVQNKDCDHKKDYENNYDGDQNDDQAQNNDQESKEDYENKGDDDQYYDHEVKPNDTSAGTVKDQVSGDSEDSETGLPEEVPKTGGRVVSTVLVPENSNNKNSSNNNILAELNIQDFSHFFYNQLYPGLRSPFQTYPRVSIFPPWTPRFPGAPGLQQPLNFAHNSFHNSFLVPTRQLSQQQKYPSL